MGYEYVFLIANENNDNSKDRDYKRSAPADYEYTQESMKKVFATLNPKRKCDIAKADYQKASMPDLQALRDIVRAIEDFYNSYFAYDGRLVEDIINGNKVKIRFFLHVGARGEYGDYDNEREIRIFCRNLPGGVSFSEKLSTISGILKENNVDTEVWFRMSLTFSLAHELYHLFHRFDFNSIGKKIADGIVNDILKEVFAESFACAFLSDYLHRNYPGVENVIRNNIVHYDGGSMVLFGVGRKGLLKEFYSKEEIDKDNNDYRTKLSNHTALKRDPGNRGLSTADYAGGFKLKGAFTDGNKGVTSPDYKKAYDNMLNGNSAQALYDLIELQLFH